MPMPTMITDRTLEDVQEALAIIAKSYDTLTPDEATAYQAGLKGLYKITDINRVQAAMAFLADEKLVLVAFAKRLNSTRTWTRADIPRASDMAAYLGDVRGMAAHVRAIYSALSAPLPAGMAGLTFSGANQIEQALLNIWRFVQTVLIWSQLDAKNETWAQLDAKGLTWGEYFLA